MKLLFTALVMLFCLMATPVRADSVDEVRGAFDKVLATGWFRAHAWGPIFGPELPSVSGEVLAVLPDRLHVRTPNLEFIVLPDGAWTQALGIWVPTDPALLPVTAFDPSGMRRAIASIRDVQHEGFAEMKTCTADVYRFHAAGQLPGAQAGGAMKLWKCRSDGRPARVEATDTRGNRITMVFDWSQPVSISAP